MVDEGIRPLILPKPNPENYNGGCLKSEDPRSAALMFHRNEQAVKEFARRTVG